MGTLGTGNRMGRTPEPARAHSLLEVELGKWDRDFRFLLGCFQACLSRIREGARLPERGAQALSMAFQLLSMVEENTANQVRRLRETAGGPASEPGAWPSQLRLLREASFTDADVRRAMRSIHVQPVLTAHPTESKRASVLERHREVYLMLVDRENPTKTPME